MKNKFLKCGLCGWCLEVLWTGFHSFRRRELNLRGESSLWMFPIYGSAAMIGPLYRQMRDKNMIVRGMVYASAIFFVEYLTGAFLKKKGICPWDYSRSRFNIDGVIRLDYAPVWFLTGLLYEKLLKDK